MATVQDKVKRSVHLLQSLNDESKRWEFSKQTFSQRYDTLVGDNTIGGAFLSYAGWFDQQIRGSLVHQWGQILNTANIKHRFIR